MSSSSSSSSFIIQSISLLLFPTIALAYAWFTAFFLWMWGEAPMLELIAQATLPTTTLWISSFAIYYGCCVIRVDDAQEEEGGGVSLIPAVIVSAIILTLLSLFLIRKTRIEQVEGGPSPLLRSAKNNSKNNKENTTSNPAASQPPLVIVITGSNTGIGKETALQLLQYYHYAEEEDQQRNRKRKVTIVLACRSLSKAEAAKQDIIWQIDNERSQKEGMISEDCIDLLELDLSNLDSVRKAAKTLGDKYPTGVDILVNNAGLMMNEQQTTKDGYELVMQANHLGHYLLTRLLVPQMIAKNKNNNKSNTGSPCIINVTSCTYVLTSSSLLDNDEDTWDDWVYPNSKKQYSLFGQYAVSKLSNILFTQELAQRYPQIQSHAVHPGLVRTDVVRNMPWYLRIPNQIFAVIIQTFQKTPPQGAWNTVHVIMQRHCNNINMQTTDTDNTTNTLNTNGLYWVNRKPQALRPKIARNSPRLAKTLWSSSSKMVGLPEEEEKKNE